ncbi:hypothetical protein [Streptomyces sp. NPDC058382]|uniref:hypothetical protein n=1 Tax=unclassified Streptomyces TaxID=2593676 RepID=UPI00362B53EA
MAHAPALPPSDRREPGEIFGSRFTLFADMLLIGLLTGVACLPVITVPAAFAAASATLRDTAGRGAPAGAGVYVRHLRARLTAGALAVGLVPPLLLLVLLVDSALVRSELPGAAVMAPALALTTLGTAVVGLRATALGTPHRWARESLVRSVADPRGSLLLAAAVVLAVLLAWAIPLLVPLLPGPLAFAATAVDLRSTADG